jgi:hypothetical protein
MQKVLNVSNGGEPRHFQPFGIIAEGAFYFHKLFFRKRRVFERFIVLVLRCRKIGKD